MVLATKLKKEDVKLLDLRNGSVILEFELSGRRGTAAAKRLQKDASQLQTALCKAATVGMDPTPFCDLEVLRIQRVFDVKVPQAKNKDKFYLWVAVLASVCIACTFCLIGWFQLVGCWCLRLCVPKSSQVAPVPVVDGTPLDYPEERPGKLAGDDLENANARKDDVSDTASTAPPEAADGTGFSDTQSILSTPTASQAIELS